MHTRIPDRPASPVSRPLGRSLILLGALLALSPGAVSSDGKTELIESARTAIEKWVEVRRILSKEKRDWEVGREMLQDRIELTRDQIESLRERTAETGRSIGETDRQRQELVEENERLEVASASIRETVVGLEARTRALVARLPDPAKERVNLLVQRLPRDPEATELSLSDRFLDVVGILNELDKFNREITVTSEVHALEGGRSLEVAALYVGLGQGYYVSPDGKLAGVGRPTENGWAWTPHDEAAPEIAKAIAILEDGDVADFVNLPLRVE